MYVIDISAYKGSDFSIGYKRVPKKISENFLFPKIVIFIRNSFSLTKRKTMASRCLVATKLLRLVYYALQT